MYKSLNTLPVQTYVRSRVDTTVTDVGDESDGSISLELAKHSDVTFIVVSNHAIGQPELFVAAVGRAPSLSDFDVVISPIDPTLVKAQNRVTLRLPPGSTTINWKGFAADGTLQPFPTQGSRLVLAIDQ